VDYDTFARPAEESLRKLCYDLLREAENYYFDTVYSEETIAGDLGQKLAAIRLYLHPNLAGILATPEYLYILEGLPVDLCVTFLLEGMLRLRTSFVDTELRAKPLQALRTSTSEIAKLFTFFDLRNKIVEEQKPEYIVID
jgi:hypothetical protein